MEKGWGPRLRFRQQHVLFLDIMAGKKDHKKGERRIIFCGFQDNVNLNVDANVSLFSFYKVLKVKYLYYCSMTMFLKTTDKLTLPLIELPRFDE